MMKTLLSVTIRATVIAASVILVMLTGGRLTQPAPMKETFQWQPVPLRTAEQKARGYVGGEMGQMAYTIAISPSNPNYLAVGIDTAATYVSTDAGKSWQLKRRGIISHGVQSVAFDPKNPGILWAAGLRSAPETPQSGIPAERELSRYIDPKADGIYRSTDSGDNWQLLRNATFLRRQAQNEYFAFDPASFDGAQHSTVYVATHREGLLKTTDTGLTWRVLGFPNTRINAVIVHPRNPRLLFIATDTGLFRSDDAGERFSRVGRNLPDAQVYGLVASAKDPNVLYIACGEEGIWRSDDRGQTFQPCMNGIPEWHAHVRWARLCISPANPNYLYADATQVGGPFPYWSHDGGASWHPVEECEQGFLWGIYWAEGFVAHPTDPNIVFHLYPVRKTTDGGRTWRYSSDGISGCRRSGRTSIAFRPDDPKKMVFFHADHGAALTTDAGNTFIHITPPEQRDLGGLTTPVGAYDPRPGARKLISAVGGWQGQAICISEDDGKTWSVQRDTVGSYQFLAFHPQEPNVVYAGRTRDSLRSCDSGRTWQRIPHPIKAMFPQNGNIVFSSRNLDAQGWESEVLMSSDQGKTWTPLPGRIIGSLGEIDVDPKNPNRLYAASHTGVWVFDAKGWNLRNEQHGLEKDFFGELIFKWIAVDPTHPNVIYAGQCHPWRGVAKGIFRSTNYGEHWENITGNLGPDLTVWAITVSPHDGTLWLGTDYGNWKLERAF